MTRPQENEYAPFFHGYVARVSEDDILPVLQSQIDSFGSLLKEVNPDRETYRYGAGKWSIREVAGHVIDSERVFGYRLFSISRGEQKSLPGFDENEYMNASSYNHVSLTELFEEFKLVRSSNLAILRAPNEEVWRRKGIANDSPVTVRALAFIMVGHVRHHMHVLSERYRLHASAGRGSSTLAGRGAG